MLLPSITISGPAGFVFPVKTVCVSPSMVVPPLLRLNSPTSGFMVKTPAAKPGSLAGMLNPITWGPPVLLAAMIASRSDITPSGPGKSPTCCGPPKSTMSEEVFTMISGVLAIDIGDELAIESNTIAHLSILCFNMSCLSFFEVDVLERPKTSWQQFSLFPPVEGAKIVGASTVGQFSPSHQRFLLHT